MNIGRLYNALKMINNEFIDFEILQLLNGLSSHASLPVNANIEQIFKNNFSQLSDVLRNAPSNGVSPICRNMLDEIDATKNIGEGLLNRIIKILNTEGVTSVHARPLIDAIIKEVQEFYKTVVVMIESINKFKIKYTELEEGDFEIGISLPPALADSSLEGFEKEIHEIDRCLKTFNEIACGDVKSIEIKTISSSNWQIFFNCLPEVTVCFAITIERIISLYKSHLEIKKIKEELAEKKIPNNVTEPLKEYIEVTIKNEIQKIADDLVEKFYKGEDTGRRNELTNASRNAVKYLADRIDRGAIFQAEAKIPEEPVAISEGVRISKEFQTKLKEFQKKKELADIVLERGRAVALWTKQNQPLLCLTDKSSEEKN